MNKRHGCDQEEESMNSCVQSASSKSAAHAKLNRERNSFIRNGGLNPNALCFEQPQSSQAAHSPLSPFV